jgi:hypothetical protein
VPPVVNIERFRKPDLHGDEKVQMTEVRRQKTEDRSQKTVAEAIVDFMRHPPVSEFGIRMI